jgi:hypothetical protein
MGCNRSRWRALYNNPPVRNVFKKYNYTVYPTGADNSTQNGPVKRSHRTVSQGVKAILIGAGLDIKFLAVCI